MTVLSRNLPVLRRAFLHAAVTACVAFALPITGAGAQATLSGSLTVDNSFRAYLSTSATQAGREIASGNDWRRTYSFSNVLLTEGQDYYLHVTGVDVGVIAAFMGSFSLTGGGFTFSNGLQTLTTNTHGLDGESHRLRRGRARRDELGRQRHVPVGHASEPARAGRVHLERRPVHQLHALLRHHDQLHGKRAGAGNGRAARGGSRTARFGGGSAEPEPVRVALAA